MDVKTDGPSFEAGVPKLLFESRPLPGRPYYAVSSDGQRFLNPEAIDKPAAIDHRQLALAGCTTQQIHSYPHVVIRSRRTPQRRHPERSEGHPVLAFAFAPLNHARRA